MKKISSGMILLLFTITVLFILFASTAQAANPSLDQKTTLSGWFSILWGDGEDGTGSEAIYLLQTNSEDLVKVAFSQAINEQGGIRQLDRQYIEVQGDWLLPLGDEAGAQPVFMVDILISPDPQGIALEASPLVSGSQPWISIMCKFNDVSSEPKNLSYFQGMYGSSFPGLDHYWRELSNNIANISGSTALGWYTLPQPRSYYVYNNALDFNRAASDCTSVADPYVNFSPFIGINLMFNADLDGYAWGGGHYMTLDGVSRVWKMTWEPPWGYSSITVIAHEMGHGFGLPHSSGAYGQTYDNRWDVMSDTWTDCSNSSHGTYGCLGQHTISYHKDILGWIPPEYKFIAGGGSQTVTLEQLALPQTGNYRMAQIPIAGSSTHFYTVEVRRTSGYDVKLPGQAVVIHEVDTNRDRPAFVIDIDGNGNTGDNGAMWLVGETFQDASNNISVKVEAAGSSNFTITITTPDIPPGAFQKSSPANGSTNSPVNPSLFWSTSAGASSYDYCIDTTNDNSCSSWITTGNISSVALSGLEYGTTYYWQVRAQNTQGTVYANGGSSAFWSFTTSPMPVSNDDFNQAISINTPYSSSQSILGATTAGDDPNFSCVSGQRSYSVWYRYTPALSGTLTVNTFGSDYDTVLGLWGGSRGALTSLGCNDDANGSYQSQVSVNVTAGTAIFIEVASYYSSPAGTNLVISATQASPPGSFNKVSPGNGTTNQPTSLTLAWGDSLAVASYEVCYDKTNDGSCTEWVSNGISTTRTIQGLDPGASYYWQVRAVNPDGITYANGTSYWSFSTSSNIPAPFLETFHQDVFSTASWTRSDTSALVMPSSSLLHIGPDGANGDHALKAMNANLPLVVEARLRLVSGGNNYRLPWIILSTGTSQLSISYLHGAGWIFKDQTDVLTKAPPAENYWVTFRAIIRPDGGDLFVRHDGDAAFNYVASRAWSFSGPITSIMFSQPADASVDLDYLSVNFTPSFSDVPSSHWAWQFIESLYRSGITAGCSTTSVIFCPESLVTRAQMAVFLERGLRGAAYVPPPATGAVFSDVPINYWAAAWIEKLAADGITSGCGSGNYCPGNSATRAEMAVFLLRAKYGSSYIPPKATGIFSDVPRSYWASDWIEQLYAEGITGGCNPGSFCPNNPVTRAQMAVFLVRTFGLP